MASNAVPAGCPCQSGLSYAQCCEPLHTGMTAPSAERLMRSRYSAYVLHRHDYLLATWHADTRPSWSELEADAAQTRWLGLKIVGHADTDPGHAIVEFVARYRVGCGRAVRLHEISRFLMEDGRWWYVNGRFVDDAR